MGDPDNGKKGRLRALRVVDVPLRELSGICLRRCRDGQMELIAVGDRAATVAVLPLAQNGLSQLNWQTISIGTLTGSEIPNDNPQIEAVCADGEGRLLLLQESPARAEFIDPGAANVVASIELSMEGDSKIVRSWSDPEGSRGEGAVLLSNGHLLIAKEKKPSALIEFGPPGSRPQGLMRGGVLASGARWPIEKGHHRFVALAVWFPDKELSKACDDFSDLEVGPDGHLYVLSDKSATIARLDDLPPEGGDATLAAAWQLKDLDGKPEGLSFTAEGAAIVALDRRKARRNLALMDPPIAAP